MAASFMPEPSGACTSAGEHGQVVGAVGDGVAVEAEQLGRGVDRMGDQPAGDHRRRDAARYVNVVAMPKLPPPPRSAQKRSGSDASVTSTHVAVGVHELDREQVVGGEAVLRHQPAEAAAERQSGDARRGDRAAGDGEAVLGRRGVQLRPVEPALGPHRARLRVDLGALHLGEVDHHGVVGDRAAGDVVAAAADADVEAGGSREAHAGGRVGCASAAHDHGGRRSMRPLWTRRAAS